MYCEFRNTLKDVQDRMIHEICDIMTDRFKRKEDQCYSDYEALVKQCRETELLSELFLEYTVKKHCTKECDYYKYCLRQIKDRQEKSKSLIEDSSLLSIII